jgi:hypothetical protein
MKLPFQGMIVAGLVGCAMILGEFAASAAGFTLYTQGDPNVLSSTPFSDPQQPQFVAGKFTLGGLSEVQTITWAGVYFDSGAGSFVSPGTDNFSLYLFQDSGGAVGTQIGGPLFTGAATTRVVSTNADLYNYSADVTPTSLAAGTYWLGISNDATATPALWAWNASTNADGAFIYRQSLSTATSGYSLTAQGTLVFSVVGVPEPSAAMGILVACGMLTVVRFRRSR